MAHQDEPAPRRAAWRGAPSLLQEAAVVSHASTAPRPMSPESIPSSNLVCTYFPMLTRSPGARTQQVGSRSSAFTGQDFRILSARPQRGSGSKRAVRATSQPARRHRALQYDGDLTADGQAGQDHPAAQQPGYRHRRRRTGSVNRGAAGCRGGCDRAVASDVDTLLLVFYRAVPAVLDVVDVTPFPTSVGAGACADMAGYMTQSLHR